MKNLIIIPAYNEEGSLSNTVASLQGLPDSYDIVIINDGSSDKTKEVAQRSVTESRLKVQVINLPVHGGIGVAMQAGYLFATKGGCYDYVIQFDADGQHDGQYVEPLVKACKENEFDLCIGSRFLLYQEQCFRSTLARRMGIRFYCFLIRFLSGLQVTDPTSGFRCLSPKVWKYFAEHYPDDYPEPVSLFWCARNKLKIGEIAVRMREREAGVSSIRSLKVLDYMLKVSLAILIDRMRRKEMSHVER